MKKLPLARPFLGDEEIEACARVLRSGRLVLGPENLAFEEDLTTLCALPHAVAVASGTAAVHVALWALDLPAKSEVIVPSFTFPAPANVVRALGLRAVLVDVDEHTWNLSVAGVQSALNKNTAAIIAVDQFGLLAEHKKLAELADSVGAKLIEDAACALGAKSVHGAAGSFGVAGCFSFHPRKIISVGEGGAVVLADAALADVMRARRNHGQTKAGTFSEPGLNFRLPEMAAAIGRVQLSRLPRHLAERADLASAYQTRLEEGSLAGRVSWQKVRAASEHVWQTFAILLPGSVHRTRVIEHMLEQDIQCGVATYALHRTDTFADAPDKFPVSDVLSERALALPLFSGMTADDVDRVVSALEGVSQW